MSIDLSLVQIWDFRKEGEKKRRKGNPSWTVEEPPSPPPPPLAVAATQSTSLKLLSSFRCTASELHQAVRGKESRDLWGPEERASAVTVFVPQGYFGPSVHQSVFQILLRNGLTSSVCGWGDRRPLLLRHSSPECFKGRAGLVGRKQGLWFKGGGSGKIFMLVQAAGRLTKMRQRAFNMHCFCAYRHPAHIVVRLSGRWEAVATWWDDSNSGSPGTF